MKQKVFTLLTLLVLCVTGAWADDPITVTWPMIDGDNATSQAGSANVVGVLTVNDATLCPTSDFDNLAWTTSKNLSYSTGAAGDDGNYRLYAGGVAVTNNPNTDNDNASVNDKCYLKFTFTVAGDKTFTPTGFSFDCGKAATDAGCVQGALILADETKSTSSIVKPTRSDKKYVYESHVSKTIVDADAFAGGSTVTFYIYVGGKLSGKSIYFKDVTITGTYAAATTAENAPEKPTFSVDGGAVNGGSTTTIESTYATKIFYAWTASSEAPAVGNAAYTEVSGDSYVYTIPNTTATMYLHAYSWNNHSGSTYSDIKSAQFNVTKVYSPAKTWNFTSTPADVLEALGNTSNWNYDSGSGRYTNKSTVAADSELGTLTASSWSGIQVGGSIGAGNLRINKDAYIQLNGGSYYYTIKSLKDGDVVKVRCYSANQTSDRSLTITGGDVTSASAPQSNNGYAETTITKDGDGDLRLTNSGGGINIMSIALNEDLPAAPTVAISTASGKTYATYVTSYALDFSTVSDDIKAYVAASDPAGGNITFTGKDAVPAGTPILVKTASAGATVNVPVASSAPGAVGTNKLVAGTGAAISYNAGESHFYYILTSGQFKTANNSVVAVGKAYLSLDAPASANELTISFDDEDGGVTGIQNLTPALSKGEGAVFDLQGRRVAQPTKGLYIVNGKKVVLK